MDNWRETIISQYDNSPRLLGVVAGENSVIDPAVDIRAFYNEVFNPFTASGWGLDCWGRIVGIDRLITLQGSVKAFGFQGSGLQPFNQAPFYSPNVTSNYRLGDNAYRDLIFLKAAINISNGSLADINRIMAQLFKNRGKAWVIHTGTMQIRFGFDFNLLPYERALLAREDVPPKPAGVGFDVYEIPKAKRFGFRGSGLQPFGQGTFAGRPQHAYTANT